MLTVTALVTIFGYDENEMRNLIRDNSTKAYLRYAKQLSYNSRIKRPLNSTQG